jgi:U3 small nucleolar RNA-associated protein 5
MVLCAFGPGNSTRYFACVTHDSRVRLFDTASGAVALEAIEQGHLSISYTALAWAPTSSSSSSSSSSPPSSSSSKRKRAAGGSDEDESPGLLALGTKAGLIVLFDLALGKAVKTFSGHASAVTSLVFGRSHNVLFSGANGEKHAIQWNTASGKRVSSINIGKRGASCLALASNGAKLAAASSSIRMFDVASSEKMQKFSGYATRIRDAKFSNDGGFLFSIAPERFSSVFRCSGGSADAASDTSGDAVTPVHNFSMPTAPHTMDFQQDGGGGGGGNGNGNNADSDAAVFHFLTTTEDGAMYVWRWSPSAAAAAGGGGSSGKKKKKQNKKSSRKKGTAAEVLNQTFDGRAVSSENAVCARFAGDRIIVAVGEANSPVFRMVEYLDPSYNDGRVLPRIDVQGASSATATAAGNSLVGAVGQMEDASAARRKGGEAYVGSALSQGAAMAPMWPEPAKKRNRAASAEADEDDASSDEDDASSDDDDEMALVERVQALEEQLELSTPVDSNKVSAAATNAAGAQVVLNKGSLVRVLEQALHANDDALLEHCLGTTDKRVIEATVGGLTPRYVIPFLSRVVAKFEARPARGKLLTMWIQSVIENHASYIVSTPSVLKTLSGLHESIDARLGAFKRLLKLSGRLDLVLSQMSVLSAARGESDAISLAMQDPVARFVDTEE